MRTITTPIQVKNDVVSRWVVEVKVMKVSSPLT